MRFQILFAVALLVSACGFELTNEHQENLTADVYVTGPAVATGGTQVTLYAKLVSDQSLDALTDQEGDPVTFRWRQVAGTPVTSSELDQRQIIFTAPPQADTLVFAVAADDGISLGVEALFQVQVLHNSTPIARAGLDTVVNVGSTVVLDGSASSDEDGDPLEYAWKQISGPTVSLSAGDVVQPVFTAPSSLATMQFSLRVSDGVLWSAESTVLVATNNGPVAAAVTQVTVAGGDVVSLDGSASSDGDGDPIQYTWEQVAGDTVLIENPQAAQTSFIAPVRGQTLIFRLRVHDGKSEGEPVVVKVDVRNPPVADAGQAMNVLNQRQAVLIGEASSPDGLPIDAYEWRVISAPIGATWVANGTDSSVLQMIPYGKGLYQLGFKVATAGMWSSEDIVLLTASNNPPVLSSGGNVQVDNRQAVQVSGNAVDADGDTVTYQWSVVQMPSSASYLFSNDQSASTDFTPSGKGAYTLQLSATDTDGANTTVQISVLARNNAPQASAFDRSGRSLSTGSLEAVATDADGDVVTYLWSLVTAPVGADPVLSGITASQLFVTPDKKGAYVFALVVGDGEDAGTTQYVTYTATNNAPTAHAGFDQAHANGGADVELSGTLSSDIDGDSIVQWNWTQIAGSSVSLDDNDSATAFETSFVAPNTKETLTFQLVVSDGTGWSDADYVQVTIDNFAPVADPGNDFYAVVGTAVSLFGQGYDAEGDNITGYEWTQVSGDSVVLSSTSVSNPSFTMIDTIKGAVVLALRVSDGKSWSQWRNVTITGVPGGDCCIFVSAAAATDGTGSAADPVSTISEALPLGRAAGKPVIVADGLYGYTSMSGGNAVDLYGSYVSDGTGNWSPSTSAYATIIEGDGSSSQTRSLNLGTMTDRQYEITGFFVRMGVADGTGANSRYGVVCSSCWVDFHHNKVEIDARNTTYAYTLYVNSNNPVSLRYNYVTTAFAVQRNTGVYILNSGETTFEDNTLVMRPSIRATPDKYGLWAKGASTDPLIRRNVFYVNGTNASDDVCRGITVTNNDTGTSNTISNNIFVMDASCNGAGLNGYDQKRNNIAIDLQGGGSDWRVSQNLFYGSGNNKEIGVVHYSGYSDSVGTSPFTVNNIFHDLGEGIIFAFGWEGWRINSYVWHNAFYSMNCAIRSWDDCATGSTEYGQYPVLTHCSFENAAADDFRLKSSSACIDQGRSSYSVGPDILQNPRPVNWPDVPNATYGSGQDIGPYEMPLP